MLTLSEERKFHLIFAQGSESTWERKFLLPLYCMLSWTTATVEASMLMCCKQQLSIQSATCNALAT